MTLFNQLWDSVCTADITRRGVEFTSEIDGMEFTVGELKVPAFYFYNEKKFWSQLRNVLKLSTVPEYWMRAVMQQKFVNVEKLSLIYLQGTLKMCSKNIYLLSTIMEE